MRIQFYVLATDTDMGLEVFPFRTEEKAYRHLYRVVEDRESDEPKPTFEEFMEDPCEYYEEFKRDYLDQYNLDCLILNISLRKIIRDSILLHPAFSGLAHRCRSALRFARKLFGRADHSHPA